MRKTDAAPASAAVVSAHADAIATVLLSLFSAEVGPLIADRAMRAAMSRAKQAARRGPNALTQRMLRAMWATIEKRKEKVTDRALYLAMEDVLETKGYRQQPGSVKRSLERHWPAYRKQQESRKALRIAVAVGLLGSPLT